MMPQAWPRPSRLMTSHPRSSAYCNASSIGGFGWRDQGIIVANIQQALQSCNGSDRHLARSASLADEPWISRIGGAADRVAL